MKHWNITKNAVIAGERRVVHIYVRERSQREAVRRLQSFGLFSLSLYHFSKFASPTWGDAMKGIEVDPDLPGIWFTIEEDPRDAEADVDVTVRVGAIDGDFFRYDSDRVASRLCYDRDGFLRIETDERAIRPSRRREIQKLANEERSRQIREAGINETLNELAYKIDTLRNAVEAAVGALNEASEAFERVALEADIDFEHVAVSTEGRA